MVLVVLHTTVHLVDYYHYYYYHTTTNKQVDFGIFCPIVSRVTAQFLPSRNMSKNGSVKTFQ